LKGKGISEQGSCESDSKRRSGRDGDLKTSIFWNGGDDRSEAISFPSRKRGVRASWTGEENSIRTREGKTEGRGEGENMEW